MNILHICPDSVGKPAQLYLGSTKDALGRDEYFQARGLPYQRLLVRDRSDDWLCQHLGQVDLGQFTTVIVELPLYPKAQALIRRRAPQLRILVRPINAEFYHQLHFILARGFRMRSRRAPGTVRSNGRTLRNAFMRLQLDFLCARRADAVLCITRWEQDHYWRFLAGPEKTKCLPYFLPEAFLQAVPAVEAKQMRCACLTSTIFNPLLLDTLRNYARFVRELGAGRAEWDFVVTGELSSEAVSLPARITALGLRETPFEVLAGSRAMAQLSDYGFGFKTKLLDATACKCYILVTAGLYARLPQEMRPWCIRLHRWSQAAVNQALDRALHAYPNEDPNAAFRAQAFSTLDQLLGTP